jgi:tRNA (adenine57-N1/adenine58-N1)-methyltransferase
VEKMKKSDFHFPPLLRKLKRGGPAITLPKDFGIVAAYTGIGKNSFIVEIGTGSGFMTVQLANVAKEVVTYEKRQDFAKLAEENIRKSGLQNVRLKIKDALDGIDEKDVDLVFCDIPEAEKVAASAYDALKKDGFLAAHCLNVEQAKALVLECKKYFEEVFMVECIVRQYEVREFGTRPKHIGLMHTAYLVFARK